MLGPAFLLRLIFVFWLQPGAATHLTLVLGLLFGGDGMPRTQSRGPKSLALKSFQLTPGKVRACPAAAAARPMHTPVRESVYMPTQMRTWSPPPAPKVAFRTPVWNA